MARKPLTDYIPWADRPDLTAMDRQVYEAFRLRRQAEWLREVEEQHQEFLRCEYHQLTFHLEWDETSQVWREAH